MKSNASHKTKEYILKEWHNKTNREIASELKLPRANIARWASELGLPSKKQIINEKANLAGNVYGKLSVLSREGRKSGKIWWFCQCECGNFTSIPSCNLTSGHTQSCGCKKVEEGESRYSNIVGEVFGRLTVIKRINRKWECKCECGKVILTSTSNLKRKNTTSCGCYHTEIMSGSNSHLWKGGVTKYNDKLRRLPEHREWTTNIKKKFNYTCQKCFTAKGRMCAHHLWPFYKYTSKRLDEDNGTCLCWDCHEKFHYKRKLDDISPKELDIFIKNKA